MILPCLTPFEEAFFDYSDLVAAAKAEELPIDFYFKRGSLAETQFRQARENGGKSVAATAVAMASREFGEDVSSVVTYSTTAEEGDVKSLNRALDRTLYLVVKKPRKEHAWQFVQGGVERAELLHEASVPNLSAAMAALTLHRSSSQTAERELKEECGDILEFWLVGKRPVAHHVYRYEKLLEKDGAVHGGTKVAFTQHYSFPCRAAIQYLLFGRQGFFYVWSPARRNCPAGWKGDCG